MTGPSSAIVMSGAQDSTVRTWGMQLTADGPTADGLVAVGVGRGHVGTVECLSVGPSRRVFASGAWDGGLLLWNVTDNGGHDEGGAAGKGEGESVGGGGETMGEEGSAGGRGSSSSSSKRQRVGGSGSSSRARGSLEELSPALSLLGHTKCVSGLAWTSASSLFTGSWDHSIRGWDVETGTCTATMNGNKVVTALSYSPLSKLLASAHPDHAVRLWDPRVGGGGDGGAVVKLRLASHTKWVSAVAWSNHSEHVLLSGSHDSSLKIWDVRSTVPLHTIDAAHEKGKKVLCVGWKSDGDFVSGGGDCKLKTFRAGVAGGEPSKA